MAMFCSLLIFLFQRNFIYKSLNSFLNTIPSLTVLLFSTISLSFLFSPFALLLTTPDALPGDILRTSFDWPLTTGTATVQTTSTSIHSRMLSPASRMLEQSRLCAAVPLHACADHCAPDHCHSSRLQAHRAPLSMTHDMRLMLFRHLQLSHPQLLSSESSPWLRSLQQL